MQSEIAYPSLHLSKATDVLCSARMHYVVFDEADLLLTGGFEKDVRRLREAFQLSDRMREIDAISLELDIDAATYQLLPVHIRKAGIEGTGDHTCVVCRSRIC